MDNIAVLLTIYLLDMPVKNKESSDSVKIRSQSVRLKQKIKRYNVQISRQKYSKKTEEENNRACIVVNSYMFLYFVVTFADICECKYLLSGLTVLCSTMCGCQ